MAIGAVQLNPGHTFSTTYTTTAIDATAYTKFYVVVFFDTGSFVSFADSHSNTYTQVGTEATSINGAKVRRYLCESGVGDASHTFTLNITPAGSIVVFPIAITGAAATALDQAATPNDDSASPYVSNSVTTTQANELLVSCTCDEGGSAGTTHTEGTGFTVLTEYTDGTSMNTSCIATRSVSSTGSYNSSFTLGAAVSASLVTLDTFKELVASSVIQPMIYQRKTLYFI